MFYSLDLDADPPSVADNDQGVQFVEGIAVPPTLQAFSGVRLVVLPPGTPGDYQHCTASTRFVANLDLSTVGVGGPLCAVTPGHRMALMRVRHLSGSSESNPYGSSDVIVWQASTQQGGT